MNPEIKLVPTSPDHAALWQSWLKQPSAQANNAILDKTLEQLAARMTAMGGDLSNLAQFQEYQWFISYDGTLVGTVTLKNINHPMGFAEIGYGVDEAHQGRGIATSAVRLLVADIFRKTKLHRLQALISETNLASIRVMEKVGFRRDGLLREHHVIQGKRVNMLLFAILRREWNS